MRHFAVECIKSYRNVGIAVAKRLHCGIYAFCSIRPARQIKHNHERVLHTIRSNVTAVSRLDYFNVVWNINPDGLITNYQTQVEVIKQLARSGKKLILLTSAPKVWQTQVTDFLGISQVFESVYTGEDFGQKAEIFSILAQRYQPEKIISVGDQRESDIDPADALGMETLLVTNPNDLEKLFL